MMREEIKQVIEKRLSVISQRLAVTTKLLNAISLPKTGSVPTGNGLNDRINSFNNSLIELWQTMVGYGFAADPYYGKIELGTGSVSPLRPSSFGINKVPIEMGMPDLFKKYMAAIGTASPVSKKYTDLTRPYQNVIQYPFEDRSSRMEQFRRGSDLDSDALPDDLKSYRTWLDGLNNALVQLQEILAAN